MGTERNGFNIEERTSLFDTLLMGEGFFSGPEDVGGDFEFVRSSGVDDVGIVFMPENESKDACEGCFL